MSEEFFERLDVKVECTERMCLARTSSSIRVQNALDEGKLATIEALKEMMVGRQKRARISHHTKPDGEQWTLVRCWDAEAITLDGHRGTDGEEVEVIVFKNVRET